MMTQTTPQWVAVYTNARAEKQVAERLAKLGIESYLPLRKDRRVWSDRVKMVEVPLIQSYCFARIVPQQEVKLRNVPGIVFVVSFGRGVIATIPDSQIAAMRRLVESETELHLVRTESLAKGVEVVIDGGSFDGMEGVLISDCQDGNFAVEISGLSVSIVATLDKHLFRRKV
ncbi:MAG: UpxY family transcription antiterminator [Bacteroidales bacterium]|nr:UpxY family transcription antiterminator [Bacteroidales bacterium]